MTMVGSFRWHGTPFVLSDVLLSGVGGKYPNPLALHSPINGEGFRTAAGLCQKIYLFNKNLAFVWAGSMIQAVSLAQFVRNMLQAGPASPRKLHQWLSEFPSADTNKLEGFFLIRTAFGSYEYVDINHEGWTFNDLSDVRLLGTGQSHFFEWLEYINTWHRDTHDVGYGIARMLSVIGIDMVRQFHMDLGIVENWGGSFDLLVGFPDGLRKISPIYYHFLNWIERDNKIIPEGFAPFFTMISYRDLLLAISQEGKLTYPIPSLISDPSTKGRFFKLKMHQGWHCVTARSKEGALSSLVVDRPHKDARISATPMERTLAQEYLEICAYSQFTYISRGQPPVPQKCDNSSLVRPPEL